jgi:IstB-like ATP binding protein
VQWVPLSVARQPFHQRCLARGVSAVPVPCVAGMSGSGAAERSNWQGGRTGCSLDRSRRHQRLPPDFQRQADGSELNAVPPARIDRTGLPGVDRVVGATGLGKTFVACALAHSAIRHRRSALYLHGPRMLDELAIARTDGPAHPAIGQLGSSRRLGQ